METLEQLRATAKKAADAISRIEEASRHKTNETLVGKFFKTRNSYSCPAKPSDYWWLYVRIDRIDKTGSLYATQFQTDTYGHINVEANKHHWWIHDDYVPIPRIEFHRAWQRMEAKLKAMR